MTRHFVANQKSWFGLLLSILGALIGVQSHKVHQRDFTEGKPWVFAIAGILTSIVLIVGLAFGLKFLLTSMGANL